MLRVKEVYEKQIKQTRERPDGSEFVNFGKVFDSRDVLINKHYIVSVYPYEFNPELSPTNLGLPEDLRTNLVAVQQGDGLSYFSMTTCLRKLSINSR